MDGEEFLKLAGVFTIGLLSWAIVWIVASLLEKKLPRVRAVLQQVRWFLTPAAAFYGVVLSQLKRPDPSRPLEETTLYHVAETLLAVVGVGMALGILNRVLSPERLRVLLKRETPQLLRDVARYVILILAVTVILNGIWGQDVAPVISALGIGGIVLGLALQETLSNFFSGLAILAERPFSIGDWVMVGQGIEGRVEHVTWRAVKLLTSDNEYVIYPNSVVAKEKIVNYSLPSPVQARRFTIGTSYNDAPDRVKAVIHDVLRGVGEVLADPPAVILTTAYADFAINYEVKYFIADFARRRAIEDQIQSRLWYAFGRAGIEIPFPIRVVHHRGLAPLTGGGPEAAPVVPNENDLLRATLARVPLFADLAPEELSALAGAVQLEHYGAGERVIAQGESGESLYAIVDGRARVSLKPASGEERELAILGAGDVFGEMSLLTGEPRSASVTSRGNLKVVSVSKAALEPLLKANGTLAGRFAELAVLRREGLTRAEATTAADEKKSRIAAAATGVLARIRTFFGLLGGQA